MFTLRFPFRLPSGQSIEVNADPFTCGGVQWRLERSGDWYVAKIEGFKTEQDASAFVRTAWNALKWVQLNASLAIEATPELNHVTYAADPIAAAANLSKGFGMTVDRVDGLVDGSAPSVYASDQKIFAMTGGDAQVTIITAMARVVALLRECVQFPRHEKVMSDAKLLVALDLYTAHFSEASLQARFLTLVMVMEALAKGEKRPKLVLDLLARWGDELTKLKDSVSGDTESVNALDAVGRELVFRSENSIRNQIRTLVRTTLSESGDADAESTASRALKVYDQRSVLVHEGQLEPKVLSAAFSEAKAIVERVLRARVKAALV